MTFLHPAFFWAFALVPVVLALLLWAAWQRRRAGVRLGDRPLVQALADGVSTRRRRWKGALVVLAVLLAVSALVGPRYGTRLREVNREGIDLMIALDVSLSMQAEDVAPSRLARAKNEIRKLLGSLRGDRVGLVLFAGDAFVQCPLTTDYSAIRLFLDVADPSQIPTPGTDFGAALNRAVQALQGAAEQEDTPRSRAVLIVSDGENHIEESEDVLRQAREAGVVLLAAGVGETEGAPIPIYNGSRRVGYKEDRSGQTVLTRLEEDALRELVGSDNYFRVGRTTSTLGRVADRIESLERGTLGVEQFEAYEEQYQWPLAAALVLLVLERLIPATRRRKAAAA